MEPEAVTVCQDLIALCAKAQFEKKDVQESKRPIRNEAS